MKTLLVYTLAALAFISLSGFLLYKFGDAKYNEGYSQSTIDNVKAFHKSVNDSRQDLEKQNNEVQKLDNDMLDIRALGLGILRTDTDI